MILLAKPGILVLLPGGQKRQLGILLLVSTLGVVFGHNFLSRLNLLRVLFS